MKRGVYILRSSIITLCLMSGNSLESPAWATSLAAYPVSKETALKETPKDELVGKYLSTCRTKPMKPAECATVKKEAIDILKEDLRTLGSSANKVYLSTILPVFKSDEPDLRIAAADAVGMIGSLESDLEYLSVLANDPVPDVRKAASQMLQHGKGQSLALLARRTAATAHSGRMPDTLPDPKKTGMPVSPDSTYLFFASDVTQGRLGYVTYKTLKDTMAFYKQKAKKGPLDLEAFTQTYEKALEDEQHAREQAQQEAMANILSHQPPTDPSNMEAFLKQLEQSQTVAASQAIFMGEELYPKDIFGSPKVFVLEERKIGQRIYPTKYVVLYEDQALKRPGFRLCWMTLSDQAIKTTQMTSMMGEAMEKNVPQAEDIVPGLKEKSEKERKKFKEEQLDLEKQLGL